MSNFLLNLSIKLLNIFQGRTVLKGGDSSTEEQQAGRLKSVSDKVHDILSTIAGPILIALGSVGVIYMVILGVQYAKSENDDKRATVKRRLVNLAIGVVAMFALAAMCMAIKWNVIVPELFSYMGKGESLSKNDGGFKTETLNILQVIKNT